MVTFEKLEGAEGLGVHSQTQLFEGSQRRGWIGWERWYL